MHLIDYSDYQLNISPEALLIKPIRDIFNADRTKTKEKFMQQMSYMYFMVDPRSTYGYISNESERAKLIIKQEGLEAKFKPDSKLKEAMEVYKQHTVTTSAMLLQDTKLAIDKVRKFLRDFDLDSDINRDDKGKPIYTINQITSAIDKIPELANKVAKAEKELNKEIEDLSRMRGTGEGTILENGIGSFFSTK